MQQHKRRIENKGSREQLNSIMMRITKTPHSSIYRTYHGICYIMKFNGLNVTIWNRMRIVTYIGVNIYIYNISLYLLYFFFKIYFK